MPRVTSPAPRDRATPESAEWFQKLADLVPAVLWMNDLEGHFLWCNQHWMTYTGLTLAEASEAPPDALIHPDDAPGTVACFREASLSKRPFSLEHHLRKRDGKYHWFVATTQPLFDGAGEIAYWVGAATDIQLQREILASEIHTREQIERAHRDAELARAEAERPRERLRAILAAIPTAIAVTRDEDAVFELVNNAYLELIGKRDVTGCKVSDIFPLVKQTGFIDILNTVYQSGNPTTLPERRAVYE